MAHHLSIAAIIVVTVYMLDAAPVTQKVAANLANSPSESINVNVLHRCLGHLGIDNC